MDKDNLAVPARDEFRTKEWDELAGAVPEIRVHSHIVAEDNKRVGTGQSIELVDTLYGRMLITAADLYMGSWLKHLGMYSEDYDIAPIRDMLSELPRGTFVDIGANLGCWSLALAHTADKVLAIEPQTAIYNMLCGSVALNGLSRRVIPKHCAIGRKRTTAPILTVDPEAVNNFGGTSLLQVTPDIDRRFTEQVDIYPLRDLIAPDEHVSFIKIDVEGYEYDVLLGAIEVIVRCKPIMFIEWFLSDELKLGRQIIALGYALHYINHNWLCLPI